MKKEELEYQIKQLKEIEFKLFNVDLEDLKSLKINDLQLKILRSRKTTLFQMLNRILKGEKEETFSKNLFKRLTKGIVQH